MSGKSVLSLAIVGVVCLGAAAIPAGLQAQAKPTVQIPQPGVPQIMTMEGKFVRIAYNNEGYVIVGYQLANRSVGEEWLLLETGVTVLDRVPNYDITRGSFSLETPDGKTIQMATIPEHRAGDTRALQNREKVQRDSINYFPPQASRPCALLFFPQLGSSALPYDQTELSNDRACLGRLYFRIPGGVKLGQHWLNVKFAKSTVRVPFRILTDAEEETLSKNYKDIKKQVDDTFRKKT